MNDETRELIKNSTVNAQKIRDRRIAQKEREKRREEKDKNDTIRLISKARKNGSLFTKHLLLSIIKEYEKSPEAVANYDKEGKIWGSIQFLYRNDSSYFGRDKALCEIYNSTLDESKKDKIIYFYELEDTGVYIPVMVNIPAIEELGIFDKVELENRRLSVVVDMYKVKMLTSKAKNNQLRGSFFDKEIKQRLQEAYDQINSQEILLTDFISSIHSNSDMGYFDIFKSLIKQYKTTPNEEELDIRSSLVLSVPNSPYEKMVKLFKDSRIAPNDRVVYYPVVVNSRSKNGVNLVPMLISEVMEKIQNDLPQTTFKLSLVGNEAFDCIETKVNTQEFESLLISIQNPEEQAKRSMS